MGLMMSVLVFTIGVLEALACVEHVRQSFLPLDLGRKRRRLVLDVGSGTIRHRETRRSSEFQRDPHVILSSIQAAVEEEGDEKESEELAAIFQAVEARNIHSTQIMNHQDPVFLTVNDIDGSDSCASSEISRTSTPNTVIMNMSPELGKESLVDSTYIPSDSFSELLGPKSDEAFSNQKDINISQVDIGQFVCIHEGEKTFESTDSNSSKTGKVLEPSNKRSEFTDSSECMITTNLLADKNFTTKEGAISTLEEKSTERSSLNNSMLSDSTNIKVPIGEEKKVDDCVINKNVVNFESETTPPISVVKNEINLKHSETIKHDNDNVIQDDGLEINHEISENASIIKDSLIIEPNKGQTIEKCEILVESQALSVKEPLIENKGTDEIFETQLEQVFESEKQSYREETQKLKVNFNQIEIVDTNQSNSSYDIIEYEKSVINSNQENELLEEGLLIRDHSKESEALPIKLDEDKEKAFVEFSNDAPCSRMADKIETSDSVEKITDINKKISDVCIGHDVNDVPGLIPTRIDVNNGYIESIIVCENKKVNEEMRTGCLIKDMTCDSIDSNSNIIKESDPAERKTQTDNDLMANHKILASNTPESTKALENNLDSISFDSYHPKEQTVSPKQKPAPVDIETNSSLIEKVNEAVMNDQLVGKIEQSEHDKIEMKGANDNANLEVESKVEVSKSNEVIDEVQHSKDIFGVVVSQMKEGSDSEVETFEDCVCHLTDKVSQENTSASKSEIDQHFNTYKKNEEDTSVIMEEFKSSEPALTESIDLTHVYQVESLNEVGSSEIMVSKHTNSSGVEAEMTHPLHGAVSEEYKNEEGLISSKNNSINEVGTTEKFPTPAPKKSDLKSMIVSDEEITSKDLLDVKESLKPVPQKAPASDDGGKPSDEESVKKDKAVLAKQETLNVTPFPDDVTVLVGDRPSQNQLEAVEEDITSPDKAFWLIFSGEYTKAMSKDWHSGHFCCWQCDESLTGQRYVLRDDHPYCIKCYEQVFANTCDECSKVIGIDSKDLSYKDKHWHEACFLCSKCRVSLVDKQFGSKADKIYCGNCYDAQFASRCDGCGQIFRAGTKKMEYKTRQWHEQCFCCCVCKSAIGTKSFIPREQEIYCATCYEEKFATRCVKCNKIITSGGVTYKNEPWHRECFTCTNCNTSLAGQRFTSRDEKPYCAECFGELFAKRCTACCKPITGIGGTRFISFEDRHWHNDCFICASCRSSLVGRGFITDAEDILCTECAKQKLM